jgi:hypothetical protein
MTATKKGTRAVRDEGPARVSLVEDMGELEQIKVYLGPFMERLAALSEEYEIEKASLERSMFATLSDKSFAATQAIVEEEFNKRTLVNIVKEYEESAQAVVVEGIQARRNAEKRFATKLLATTGGEFQNVVSNMREEDRRKLAYEREENKQRLDACRTAMHVDGGAQLRRQQCEMNVAHSKAEQKMKDDFQALKEELDGRVQRAEAEMTKKTEQMKKAELQLKLTTQSLTTEIDQLKVDLNNSTEECNELMRDNGKKTEEKMALQEELEEARREFLTMESRKNEEVKDLRKAINKAADDARKREAKLLERVENYKKEAMQAKTGLLTAQAEASKMTQERDALRLEIGELHETLESERQFWEAELSEKVAEIAGLQSDLKAATEKLAKFAMQIAEVEDTCSTQRAQLEEAGKRLEEAGTDLSRAQHCISNTQADVSTWIMDQQAAKNGVACDLEYHGAPHMEDQAPADVVEAVGGSHLDLHLLLQIVGGHFAGLYSASQERQDVAAYLLKGDEAQVPPEDEKAAVAAATPLAASVGEASVGATSPTPKVSVMQQLSDATRRIAELEACLESIEEDNRAKNTSMQAEWRAKCISLAQRLAKTEAEIPNPRAQDVEQIKELESQVRALMSALNAAAKEKLLQNPNWTPPPDALPPVQRHERPKSQHSTSAKETLLAQSQQQSSVRAGRAGLSRTAPSTNGMPARR